MMAPENEGTGGESAELARNDDESLPWLDTDDYEGEGGVDATRIIGFAVILLALLATVVGGIWWFSNRTEDKAIIADGSTIKAPREPYKVKPANAGGKEFAGTGNVAPGVGEGKTRDGKLKTDSVPAPAGTASPSIATRSTKEEPAVASSGVGVQVGAYGTRERAEAGWVTLQRQTTALDGVSHRVMKGQADIGTVYRLQAVAGNAANARALCNKLKADGLACQVKN